MDLLESIIRNPNTTRAMTLRGTATRSDRLGGGASESVLAVVDAADDDDGTLAGDWKGAMTAFNQWPTIHAETSRPVIWKQAGASVMGCWLAGWKEHA